MSCPPHALAQTAAAANVAAAPDAPNARSAGVVVVTGSQPSSLPTRIPTTIEGISGAQLGAGFTPRWALVTPEEIDRVDVLYGPFSAAYPGNAVGAVVDFVTRMPTQFEAHAKLGYTAQPNDLYGHSATYHAAQASASLGSREGAFAWFINANHTDSVGQPLVFGTKLLSSGAALKGGETAVTGYVLDKNPRNQDWALIGTSTQYDTRQDHLKAKLAWDITPTLRANYLLGLWQNNSDGHAASWLKDSAGNPVTSGAVNIAGKRYSLAATDFPNTRDDLTHVVHALSLQSRSKGVFDWSLAGSTYHYQTDRARASATGRLTDQAGTGWRTLNAKATWRPQGEQGAHVVDAGLGQDSHQLRTRVDAISGDWASSDALGAFVSRFDGNTGTQSLWAQDTWQFAPGWATVLGARAERWTAWGGLTQSATATLNHPERSAHFTSPKAALSRDLGNDWVLKASTGRAIRFPTVSELYQGGFNTLGQAINTNPDLRPERSQTSELSAEWLVPGSSLRATLFHEDTADALYSQLNTATNTNTVQNINRIRTTGLELAASRDELLRGLALQGSLTYTDSKIVANDGFLFTPGDTVGKWQPRVPRWRATALATWKPLDKLSLSLGARYSGRQYSALDNGDPNGFAYTGASKYFTTDVRARYQFSRQWSAAVGIDNLNNCQYWNFHPYPQRSVNAELKFDL
ncbi:MAG: TonB-dependent receptor [Burkholderiales bacterium PBB5]|nr:MAG: TonB-dependent receptor [Burkholderiales bacterium PBB5]